MPQVRPRLPNSSGGGLPPQVTIDDERWSQIKALIEPGLVGDHAGLKSEIERVTSKYLRFAGAAMSAPLLDRRGDQFNRLGRALGTVWHELEELQVGDEGDFATVAKAVAAGDVTPNEAAEIGKVIDAYVKAYQTAELDERVARVEQLSDAELMRIAMGGHAKTVTPVSRLLTALGR
jgi:hypothetical protein